jgi:hypothetical protein
MPKQSEKERVGFWQTRTESANKIYEQWEDKYYCDECEKYWQGEQWANETDDLAKKHYVINMVFPSIEIKIPSLLFYRPQVKIKPRPARADDMGSTAAARARLQEDTVNTFIADKRLRFREELTLALRESFFRFGVIEVGYSGDFIDNPLLSKPELTDEERQVAAAPRILNPDNPSPESIYIKRIPAKQFRVGVNSKNQMERCDWVGYYEDHYISDIKNNPNYKNTSGLKATGKIKDGLDGRLSEPSDRDVDGNQIGKDTIRVWKIWDMRAKKKRIFGQGSDKFFSEESFDYLPFAAYRQYENLDDWYPLPPVFNWLHPQNEKNEIREMRKIHRRRFNRRYLRGPEVDPTELEKLEDSPDGTFIEVPDTTKSIVALQDAPLDRGHVLDEQEAKSDFREISGVGAEQRGEADANVTATQANIVSANSQIRSSYQRQQVSEWIADAAWLILKTIADKMALPFWIQQNIDPNGPNAQQAAMQVTQDWKQVTSTQLGDIEYDITVDVTSMTPVADEGEKQQWLQALQLVVAQPMIVTSEILLRKTLGYFNIRNENDIAEIRKAGMMMMAMQQAMAQQKQQGGVGGQQGMPQPGPTPDNMGIQQQLMSQMGGMQ